MLTMMMLWRSRSCRKVLDFQNSSSSDLYGAGLRLAWPLRGLKSLLRSLNVASPERSSNDKLHAKKLFVNTFGLLQ